MSSKLESLLNPFGQNIENIPDKELPKISELWVSYTVLKDGRAVDLSQVFYANVWFDFWPFVTKSGTKALTKKIIEECNSNDKLKICSHDDWLMITSDVICNFIKWPPDIFRLFPWNWNGVCVSKLKDFVEGEAITKLKKWFREPKFMMKRSKKIELLEERLIQAMYLNQDKNTSHKIFNEINMDELNDSDRYFVNSLKLKYHALRDQEIPKSKVLGLISECFKDVEELGGELRSDDYLFEFRMSCDDDKTTQWQAITRYKGYVGELLFVHCFQDIVEDIPAHLRYIDGVSVIPEGFRVEYLSESQKPSISQILKDFEKKHKIEIKLPAIVPKYYPDFHACFQVNNVYTLTLFENTYSTATSVKTLNDREKWRVFVDDVNERNGAGDRNEFEYLDPVFRINVVTINVREYMQKKSGNSPIQRRITLIEDLIRQYNQFKLSHENSSVLETVRACEQLRMPTRPEIVYKMDQDVLQDLTEIVNKDVEKDYGVKNYIEQLEEPLSGSQLKEFEAKLIKMLKEKVFDSGLLDTQEKWVKTDRDNLLKGIQSLEKNLFNKERMIRLVENNHHDSTQFCTLKEGPDLSDVVQEVFDKFSDLLSLLNDTKLAKLKPTLCMMIHCSAGHSTYLTNNMQFGLCEGLSHKNSRISQLMKILKVKAKKDARLDALIKYNDTGATSAKTWSFGRHSIANYKNQVEPYLMILVKRKQDTDFNYRYTTSEKCEIVNKHNYNLVEKTCCKSQLFRFEHAENDIWATCPEHKTRYKIINPFSQLHERLDSMNKDNFSFNETVNFLIDLAKTKGTNIFLVSHITHFLSGCLSEKKIRKHIPDLFAICHDFYKHEIIKTLSKRNMQPTTVIKLKKEGLELMPVQVSNDRMKIDSEVISEKWYVQNSKYLQDKASANNLKDEIKAVSATNPFSFCIAEMAEKVIKSRSQYYCLTNSVGYVTFTKTFGPIYSSPSTADSESIKCFSSGEGHFFLNHRTLRMMQSLPLLLISNKLIVDQMSSRDFVAGNYSQDSLIQFCLLNSRRLNVNLQNVRYFFMSCWSKFHSPFLFKKLEMDFLKVAELNVSRVIITFMKQVWRNYIHMNRNQNTEIAVPDNMGPQSKFKVLFNETVKADLNQVDLCLHSFYMVHLFEKTIPGKIQEIKKVFLKFLKPKQKWFKDLEKFKRNTLSENERQRFLMSDGLNHSLEQCLNQVINDCLNHENKYAGFNMNFIKAAAQTYNGFNKNEYESEIRIPNPISDLLKSTSTVKKFTPNVDFQMMCDSVNLKKRVEVAMKQLDKETVDKLMKKVETHDDKVTMFPKCLAKLNNIHHAPASDISLEDKEKINKALINLNLGNISGDCISEIDTLLSASNFISICENYGDRMHEMKSDIKGQLELSEEYFKKFPNTASLLSENPEFCLLLFMDQLKFKKETIMESWNLCKDDNNPESTTDIDLAWCITSCKAFFSDKDDFVKRAFSRLTKDRTPKNRLHKRQVQSITSKYANPREMTTRLINEILNLMSNEVFADTYSVCHDFKFNTDPIVFGMAFKEQFGGERELTIADIWGKLTLKLQEDVCRNLGRCMNNSCLNEPSNEESFKEMIIKNQSSNQIVMNATEKGFSSSPLFGSIDRSKWGPYHQGLAFYTLLYHLLSSIPGENEDVIDVVKYSSLKHAMKKFEIHHNVAFSIISKCIKKGHLTKKNGRWVTSDTDVRPDIKMEDWELFTLNELMSGKKYIHTRMDMGQGMLHSTSDVYGAVIDYYIKRIIKKTVFKCFGNAILTFESMNTSDDRSTLMRISGLERSQEEYDRIFKFCILLEDILQRLGNMYLSEKSVWSFIINEFKSAFMRNGIEVRVIVKFLSSQLTIGKDCFPEDFWNTYNSLTKQLLNNGGSQMMCDLLYLSKLHLLQTLYTFSKSPFNDCVTEAPPSRYGFPNLSCVDIYYHTSKHIMANKAIKFLHSCGIQGGVLTLAKKMVIKEKVILEDKSKKKSEKRSLKPKCISKSITDKRWWELDEVYYQGSSEDSSLSDVEEIEIPEDFFLEDDEQVPLIDREDIDELLSTESDTDGETIFEETVLNFQKTQYRLTDEEKLPNIFLTHNGCKYSTRNTSQENEKEHFVTEIETRDANCSFYLHHKERMTCADLQMNLIKFFTLAKTPGFMEGETICAGVPTVLPSQKGKRTDKDILAFRGLRDMTYLDYFIMVHKQNTQECAKIRSNQALYQAVKQQAKKTHQNMVFAKGLLINKGNFCFFRGKSVSQEFAFRNFDCDDDEFKDISNLVLKLNDSYAPIKKILKNAYQSDGSYEIKIKNSVTTHKEYKIDLHTSPEVSLKHGAFVVRAYIRDQRKCATVEDSYIIANSRILPIVIDNDTAKFEKYYTRFSDIELMMLDMSKLQTTLSGVYMFEQSTDTSTQIGLILKGCIHNNIERKIDPVGIQLKDRELDYISIYKALIMISIWCSQDFTRTEMKNKLSKLLVDQPAIGNALMDAFDDPKLGKVCATLILFVEDGHEGAEKILLQQFRDFRNVHEIGSIAKRTITGSCGGVNFRLTIDQADQMNVSLVTSTCDDRALFQTQKRIRGAFGLINENFVVTKDSSLNDMTTLSYHNRRMKVDFRQSKFVLVMSDSGFKTTTDFFSEVDDEKDRIEKWNNCVELTTNVPLISDVATLWRIIKNDTDFESKLKEVDLSCLSLDVYKEQFDAIRRRVDRMRLKTNTRLMANLEASNASQTVVRDLLYDDKQTFKSICPEFMTGRSNPFIQVLFVCKLITNCNIINEVFSAENIVKTIKKQQYKVPEIPPIKFNGDQVTNIGIIRNEKFRMRPCSEYNTKNAVLSLPVQQLKDHFRDVGEYTILVFHRDVSVERLFAFQANRIGVYVQLIDLNDEKFVYIDMKNTGNNATSINADIAKDPNLRLSIMVEGKHISPDKLILEI